jgi:hypothetical protein
MGGWTDPPLQVSSLLIYLYRSLSKDKWQKKKAKALTKSLINLFMNTEKYIAIGNIKIGEI